jgi:hypothetical protein
MILILHHRKGKLLSIDTTLKHIRQNTAREMLVKQRPYGDVPHIIPKTAAFEASIRYQAHPKTAYTHCTPHYLTISAHLPI